MKEKEQGVMLATFDREKLIEDITTSVMDRFSEYMTNKDAITPQYVSRAEYARQNCISVSLVDKLRRSGKLESKKVGRRLLIKNK